MLAPVVTAENSVHAGPAPGHADSRRKCTVKAAPEEAPELRSSLLVFFRDMGDRPVCFLFKTRIPFNKYNKDEKIITSTEMKRKIRSRKKRG